MIALFEAGLPGDGLEPLHLQAGKPTPWTEGCIVRFLRTSEDPGSAICNQAMDLARKSSFGVTFKRLS